MIDARDPKTMTARERVGEVGQILATGYLRVLASRQKSLEVSREPTALCASRPTAPCGKAEAKAVSAR